jgi:hypothetical protein
MEGLRRYELKVNNSAFFKQFDADGDGLIDMFTVVHSGNGAENTGGEGVLGETIWSHKVSALSPGRAARIFPRDEPPGSTNQTSGRVRSSRPAGARAAASTIACPAGSSASRLRCPRAACGCSNTTSVLGAGSKATSRTSSPACASATSASSATRWGTSSGCPTTTTPTTRLSGSPFTASWQVALLRPARAAGRMTDLSAYLLRSRCTLSNTGQFVGEGREPEPPCLVRRALQVPDGLGRRR